MLDLLSVGECFLPPKRRVWVMKKSFFLKNMFNNIFVLARDSQSYINEVRAQWRRMCASEVSTAK